MLALILILNTIDSHHLCWLETGPNLGTNNWFVYHLCYLACVTDRSDLPQPGIEPGQYLAHKPSTLPISQSDNLTGETLQYNDPHCYIGLLYLGCFSSSGVTGDRQGYHSYYSFVRCPEIDIQRVKVVCSLAAVVNVDSRSTDQARGWELSQGGVIEYNRPVLLNCFWWTSKLGNSELDGRKLH